MEKLIKAYQNSIPEGYIQVNPFILLKDHRAMTMLSSGVVKINNSLICDTITKKSYSDIEIYYSEANNRFFITSIYQKVFTLSDINSAVQKNLDLTHKDVFGIYGLNPNDVEFTSAGSVKKILTPNQKYFFTVKKTKRNWDCLNYVIID